MLDNSRCQSSHVRQPAEPMKPVVDPAQWTGADLGATDDWQYSLTTAEIDDIDKAVAAVQARGMEIKDITIKLLQNLDIFYFTHSMPHS